MKRSQGFTLIELMIVIALIAVLVAMSISLAGLVKKHRLSSQAEDLIASINYARSEAIKRSTNVSVCRSGGDVCASGGTWDTGWLVMKDSSTIDFATQVLRRHAALTGGNQLTTTNGGSDLTYKRNGRLVPGVNNRTFTLTDPSTGHTKTVTITATGRAVLR